MYLCEFGVGADLWWVLIAVELLELLEGETGLCALLLHGVGVCLCGRGWRCSGGGSRTRENGGSLLLLGGRGG